MNFAQQTDDYSSLTLSRRFDAALGQMPREKPFLVAGTRKLSWGELQDRLNGAMQSFHDLELKPGDRALIGLDDEIGNCILFLACLRAGIVAIMADIHATDRDLVNLVRASRPRAAWTRLSVESELPTVTFIAEAPRRTAAEADWPELADEEAIAAIVFTSGTTAQPKGVQISRRALAAQMAAFAEVYGFGPDSRILNLLPLHHVDGLFRGLVAAAVFGAQLHRPAPFSVQALPGILDTLETRLITHFVVVPTMLAVILRIMDGQTVRAPDLRCVISSADRLEEAVWTRAQAFFGVPVINSWGQSETVCDALYSGSLADGANAIGTIGKPVGCAARIVTDGGSICPNGEVGELQITGPILMSGYFDQPNVTAAAMDGDWLRTGDLAFRESDGLFRFVGRKGNVIVSRGVSIHPENIVSVLLELPGVAEAAVLGLPDQDWGERVVACVVLSGVESTSCSELLSRCREKLPPEKRPQSILVLPELPRGAAGKVNIEALTQQIRQQEADDEEPGNNPGTVYSIAARCFGVPVETLSPSSTPFNTADWDSLRHLQFIIEVETAFGITFTPQEIIGIASLSDAEQVVQSRSSTKTAS